MTRRPFVHGVIRLVSAYSRGGNHCLISNNNSLRVGADSFWVKKSPGCRDIKEGCQKISQTRYKAKHQWRNCPASYHEQLLTSKYSLKYCSSYLVPQVWVCLLRVMCPVKLRHNYFLLAFFCGCSCWLSDRCHLSPVIHIWNTCWVPDSSRWLLNTPTLQCIHYYITADSFAETHKSHSRRNHEVQWSVRHLQLSCLSVLLAGTTSYRARWEFCGGMYVFFTILHS